MFSTFIISILIFTISPIGNSYKEIQLNNEKIIFLRIVYFENRLYYLANVYMYDDDDGDDDAVDSG
jgi:hypothetical protein